MAAQGKHREAILSAAVRLFRQQGYAATGLAEILEISGAPKGSLYHYFPGGKPEIGEKAIVRAGEVVEATLRDLDSQCGSVGDLVSAYAGLLAGWLEQSDFRDGSPLTTTLLETVPGHEPIRIAALRAFESWAAIIERAALRGGVEAARAKAAAKVSIMLIEGAMIQCRVQGSVAPLTLAGEEIRRLFGVPQA